MSIFLICIGISEYESNLLPTLPGAANDAIRVSSFFNLWGLSKDNIITLVNSEATRDNILRAIRVETLRQPEKIDTIFVYYAGHGENNTESSMNPENILYCYNTFVQDTLGTGLKIQEILNAMQRCQASKMFLFIDACYAQIRDLSDILPTIKQFEAQKSCFFALMSTWGKMAFEQIEGGQFTTQLLKGFAYLRNRNPVCSDMATYIEEQAVKLGLTLPKGYWIGTSDIWFLDGFERSYDSRVNEEQYVQRTDALIEITDKMLLDENDNVCFYGNASSGKTVLALQLSRCFVNFYYYSVRIYYSLIQTETELALLILERLAREKGISKGIGDDNLQSVIECISHLKINITIILDHAERLKLDDLNELLRKIQKRNIKVIMFSRIPLRDYGMQITNIQCPDFTIKEFELFLEKYSVVNSESEKERFYKLYRNKPQQFIQRANKVSDNEIFYSCEKAIYCICECDGFVDVELFCETFNIEIDKVITLINCGLVRKELEHFVPHESLYDYFLYDKAAVLNSHLAEEYWQKQLYATSRNEFVCNLILSFVKKKSLGWLNDSKSVLEILASYCLAKYKWEDLEMLFPFFVKLNLTGLILESSQQLAHVARNYILQYNDVLIEILCDQDIDIWNAIRGEMFYWMGDFTGCIDISKELLKTISPESVLRSYVYLNMAIAHFFLGEWDLSNESLGKILESSKRIEGWKNLISGTINAIRGVNFDKGISCLKDSIRILSEIDDVIGLGIAYGNMGECYLKRGRCDLAQYYLERGETYAILSNDYATHLEILRNKLLLVISENHAFDTKAEDIEGAIMVLLRNVSDKTELMQVYNTLATASIYKYDRERAKEYLEIAKDMTEGNLEYQLYTCINAAIISYIEGDIYHVDVQLRYINELLKKGSNYLAKYQCVNLICDAKALYNLEELNLEIWEEIKEDVLNEEYSMY